ncbi:MAG TPA: oligosaccharide flippase family protein [Gaiellaceae bacterium]|jgi:O-antigen/teichoic acid export membrane protein|nr:oligosaccharide flippase family protein [Gaiellaceae bacterium]
MIEPGLGRATLFVLLGRLGGNLGFFGAALVLARALGPSDRGDVAFITTTALVFGVVSAAGLREAGTVFLARHPARRRELVGNQLVFGMVFALAAAVVVCSVLALFPQLRPANVSRDDVLILGAGVLAIALETAGFAMTLGLALFRRLAAAQTAYAWTYAAALALAWQLWELTVTRAVIIWVAAQAFGGLILVAGVLRRVALGRPSLSLFREEWRFGIRAWVGSLSTFLAFRLDQMIIGVISTDTALGIYAVAVNASEVELYVPQSVANGLVPIIARTTAEERAQRTLRVFRLVLLAVLATGAAAFATGPYLLPLVFGHAFKPSIGPFLWLVAGGVGFVADSIFSAALVASDAPGKSSLGPFAALAVGTVLDFALIPSHGATGAAVAAAAGFFAGGLVAGLAFAHAYPVRWRLLLPGRDDVSLIAAALRRTRA